MPFGQSSLLWPLHSPDWYQLTGTKVIANYSQWRLVAGGRLYYAWNQPSVERFTIGKLKINS